MASGGRDDWTPLQSTRGIPHLQGIRLLAARAAPGARDVNYHRHRHGQPAPFKHLQPRNTAPRTRARGTPAFAGDLNAGGERSSAALRHGNADQELSNPQAGTLVLRCHARSGSDQAISASNQWDLRGRRGASQKTAMTPLEEPPATAMFPPACTSISQREVLVYAGCGQALTPQGDGNRRRLGPRSVSLIEWVLMRHVTGGI